MSSTACVDSAPSTGAEVPSGRRSGIQSLPVPTFLALKIWMGTCCGCTIAVLTHAIVRLGLPGWANHLGTLAAVVPVVSLVVVALVGWQMAKIRQSTFRRTIRGNVMEVRIRRRGEVLAEVGKRVLWCAAVALVLVAAVHGSLTFLREAFLGGKGLRLSMAAVGKTLPAVGLTALLAGAVLVPVEAVLRLTRKEGYPYQGRASFVPACLAFGVVLLLLQRL